MKRIIFEPETGQKYWFVNLFLKSLAANTKWYNDVLDSHLLSLGLVFRTKEEAQARAKKMLEVK